MKREWTFTLATNGDDRFREECWNLAKMLQEVGFEAEWESVKTDYGMLRITLYSKNDP